MTTGSTPARQHGKGRETDQALVCSNHVGVKDLPDQFVVQDCDQRQDELPVCPQMVAQSALRVLSAHAWC